MPTTPLHLTIDPWWDELIAVPFGRTVDGWSVHEGEALGGGVDLLLDAPGGDAVGFVVRGWNAFEEIDLALFDGPRFAIPRLGLDAATIGEALLAARAQFGDGHTLDAQLLHEAINERDVERKLSLWEACLDAGNMAAHFGWGCALLEDAGRPAEAYAHFRRYTEITPVNAWAWSWRGQAALAMGDEAEAERCFRRAVACEPLSKMETDAGERLEALGRG